MTDYKELMLYDRLDGKTYKQVGKKYGISGQMAKEHTNKAYIKIRKEIESLRSQNNYLKEINILLNKKLKNKCHIKERTSTDLMIEHAELSARLHNCLKAWGCVYLSDIEYLCESDILRTPNLGKKSLNEIKEVAERYCLIIGSRRGQKKMTNKWGQTT
ncbi:MAG: DNA-directed RNA polymerase subunit alpha C-terminal domain-containing protein [Bacteroidota bacterium]